jgi:hypothetical protein
MNAPKRDDRGKDSLEAAGMISHFARAVGVTVVMMAATGAVAQESTNRVAANTDWSVFEEQSPRECWAVSAPVETINSKDGQVVSARRGDIRLMVFWRPGDNINGQVMFAGGYPFAGGSTVEMDVGGTKYELFTEDETAWPATPEDDARYVDAMKRGSQAVLVGRSGRGTVTTDKFSLSGFTAAVEEAARRCAG